MTEVRRPHLVEGPIQQDWVEHAACVGSDVSVFFPPRGSNGHEARRICATCPVRVECLDYAIESRERYGIFGGKDREERAAIRRARRVA